MLLSDSSIQNILPEFELLLCCARTHLNSETIRQVENLLTSDINFDSLMQLAAQHRVKPLLYHNIVKHAPDFLSHPAISQLQRQCRQISLHNMYLTKDLLDLAEKLDAEAIQVASFKGPILATTYGDLALREISDLDFLVLESDFQKAVSYLTSQGYKLKVQVPWETHLISSSGTYSIDLHRDIVPKHLSCFADSKILWDNIEAKLILDKKVNTFTPEITLFILCLNGTKEGWCRLSRVCDVAEFVRAESDLNWQYVIELADQMGSKRLVFLGLLLAQDLLTTALPPFICQQIQADSSAQLLASKVKQQLVTGSSIAEPGEVEKTLFHISTRERWKDKLQSFLGLMQHSGWMKVTENDRDFLSLPDSLSYLYYLIRPIRVLSQYRKLLKG